jgi:hypothetical protein
MNRSEVTNVCVRFHSEAPGEADAAAQWYEERISGLGSALLLEVERAVTLIAQARSRAVSKRKPPFEWRPGDTSTNAFQQSPPTPMKAQAPT